MCVQGSLFYLLPSRTPSYLVVHAAPRSCSLAPRIFPARFTTLGELPLQASQVAPFCFFLELCSRWQKTPVDCEYDDTGAMDPKVAFLELLR